MIMKNEFCFNLYTSSPSRGEIVCFMRNYKVFASCYSKARELLMTNLLDMGVDFSCLFYELTFNSNNSSEPELPF